MSCTARTWDCKGHPESLSRGARPETGFAGSCPMRTGRHRTACDVKLLTDAEAGEDLPQEVVGGELAGYFTQRLLGAAQFFSDELAGAVVLQLTLRFIDMPAGASQRFEVPLACRYSADVERLIAH